MVKKVQTKVYSFIYLFWYPVYQLMFKFTVPILILLMYTYKYSFSEKL
jgi:hypothetical protein